MDVIFRVRRCDQKDQMNRLSIQGPSTGEVRFEVTSIRRDEAVLTEAVRGNWVTVPRPARVRPNDRVYLLEPAT